MHIRFKVLMSAAALACLLSFQAHADAKHTPRTVLLVVSKTDHTLAIIDPASRDVLVKLPVGPYPHEVAISPDGKFSDVSNIGDVRFQEINVLDIVNQKALASIDTGGLTGTHGLAYVGGKLWFTAQVAKSIARCSPETQTIDWEKGTGRDWSHMIVVTPDSKTAFVSNIDAGSVSVFDNVLISLSISSLGRPKPGAVRTRVGCILKSRLPTEMRVSTFLPIAASHTLCAPQRGTLLFSILRL